MDDREVQFRARRLARDGKSGSAIAGGGAQRTLSRTALHEAQAFGIVANLCGEAARPQLDGARHRLLHVGVAGKRCVPLPLGQPVQSRSDVQGGRRELIDDVTQVEPQRGQHLIVARTPKVNAAACRTDAVGKALLERSLAVLVRKLDAPGAALMLVRYDGQAGADRLQVVV